MIVERRPSVGSQAGSCQKTPKSVNKDYINSIMPSNPVLPLCTIYQKTRIYHVQCLWPNLEIRIIISSVLSNSHDLSGKKRRHKMTINITRHIAADMAHFGLLGWLVHSSTAVGCRGFPIYISSRSCYYTTSARHDDTPTHQMLHVGNTYLVPHVSFRVHRFSWVPCPRNHSPLCAGV